MKINFFLLILGTIALFPCSLWAHEEDLTPLTNPVHQYLDQIYKYSKFNKTIRPNFGADPVTVQMNMYIMDMDAVSVDSMSFRIDLYLRQRWNDSRLAFDNSTMGVDKLVLTSDVVDKIWVPDTFVPSAKRVSDASLGSFSDGNTFLSINHQGEVFYSHRLRFIVNCVNQIRYFPADKPICEMTFESYKHSSVDIKYEWMGPNEPVIVADKLSLIGFQIQDGPKAVQEVINLNLKSYSILRASITLYRQCCYYFVNIYLPAILLVVLSWMPFCLNDEHQKHTRIMVSAVTFLAMILLSTLSVGVILPHHYTVRAIDIYLLVCFIFILAALIRNSSRYGSEGGCKESYNVDQCKIIRGGAASNRCARRIWPIVFLLFNVAYGGFLFFATRT